MSRTYGQGSIFQRKDGRWVAKVIDPATGKAQSSYAKTEAEAKRALAKMNRRAVIGTSVVDSRATLRRFAEVWLEERAGRRRAESTLYEYEHRLKKHIYPHLGNVRLASLTIEHVEAWFEKLLDDDLSPATVRAVRNTLAAVLSDAVRQRVLAVNVARLAELPRRAESTTRKVAPPAIASTRKLLDTAATTDAEIGRLLTVIAATGCRIGEAAAASWDAIDLEAGLWTIDRTITRDREGRSKVGDTTKTREARQVRLSGHALEAMREQRRDVRRRQLAAPVWVEEGYVWPTTIGSAPDLANLRKRIRAVAQAAGFEGSAKSLRHLFASISVETVELAVVAKLLGHRRVSTTSDTYAHLLPETRDNVSELVVERLTARG